MALELLICIGVFALALGVIGTFMGSEESEKRRLREEHEARRYGPQPWDVQKGDRGGTPVR